MKLIKPSHEILFIQPNLLRTIEIAGRTCYKSEAKITKDSAEKFVERIVKSGHHSVIEHANMSVRFICDRGVSHELVRHRLAAYSQESTRYCRYENEVTFILPLWCKDLGEGDYNYDALRKFFSESSQIWIEAMLNAERDYKALLDLGWSPQYARSVLPPPLKTEVVMTANIREWMHVLRLRTSQAAHPQMQELMTPLLTELKKQFPVIFGEA